jgi:hypothetical protein
MLGVRTSRPWGLGMGSDPLSLSQGCQVCAGRATPPAEGSDPPPGADTKRPTFNLHFKPFRGVEVCRVCADRATPSR